MKQIPIFKIQSPIFENKLPFLISACPFGASVYDYYRTLFVVWTLHNDLITARSTAVEAWEEPANIWLTLAKNAFVGWALNFRVRMLLKGAVMYSVAF